MNFHKPYTQERVRFSGEGAKDVFFFFLNSRYLLMVSSLSPRSPFPLQGP